MTTRIDLSSIEGKNAAMNLADRIKLSGGRPVFELVPQKRSLSQNDMIHALYGDISKQIEDQSIVDITRECKLRYGVPILRAEDPSFRKLYDSAIKDHLTYEQKLQAMDILPVTSRMDKEQCSTYITQIISEYSKQGYALADPRQC